MSVIAAWLVALATDRLASQPERTLEGDACAPWERIECWKDASGAFPQETFLPETEHPKESRFGRGIPEALGGTAPHSRLFLLHYGPKWREATRKVPVLLVPGAGGDATRCFAATYFDGSKGLMQRLSADGFAVFAVTFACPQGNLAYHAEHLANALAVVRKRTGAAQVDVVGYSAGGIAARMYVTGVRQAWGTAYRGDIRRIVFVGVPHRGLDFTFRHPIAYQRFREYGVPAPWDWYKPQGEITPRSIYGGAYPAQLQLLADLSKVHSLGGLEADWWTTYHGGEGFVSRSRGIKKAIELGGNHMERVRAARFPKALEVFVLAGSKRLLKYIDRNNDRVVEEEGEYDGDSDGIVFVASATDPDGLKAAGARVRASKVARLNHVELIYLDEGVSWIMDQLKGGE